MTAGVVEAGLLDRSEESSGWRSRFASAELVVSAAGLFARERNVEPTALFGVRDSYADAVWRESVLLGGSTADRPGPVEVLPERVLAEGPQWRVEVAPGLVAVRARDYARAERAAQRAVEDREARAEQACARVAAGLDALDEGEGRGVSRIKSWSSKSRAMMVRRLAELDYAPLIAQGVPCLVTLTYPGDWLSVAPGASVCRRHLLALRKRFARRWGRALVGVWKREFQERGAPHYHLLMVPPDDAGFAGWLSETWADVVGAAWCGSRCWDTGACCERGRHVLAGSGIDWTEGARCVNPQAVGAYFSKHGMFAAKDYQNVAPRQWLHQGECDGRGCEGCADEGVGRFWGVWGLRRAVAAVEVQPDVALQVGRTARRWARSKARSRGRGESSVKVKQRGDAEPELVVVTPRAGDRKVGRWRKVTTVDRETGEIGWKWRRRRTTVNVPRVRDSRGFVTVPDGAAFASQLAVVAERVQRPGRRKVLSRDGQVWVTLVGPAGFLP